MKILLGIGGSGMLLGGLYASDALTAGQVYDIPIEQAFSELSSMPVPDPLFAGVAGTEAPSIHIRRAEGAIDWRFRAGGQQVALFTARLSPEGAARTRVHIDYTPGEPPTPELRHMTSATLTRDFARIAMSEQVEARLERRPISHDEVVDALARHAAANPKQVEDYGRAMAEMAAGLHRQASETSRQTSDPAIQPGRDPIRTEYTPSALEAAPPAWAAAPAGQ